MKMEKWAEIWLLLACRPDNLRRVKWVLMDARSSVSTTSIAPDMPLCPFVVSPSCRPQPLTAADLFSVPVVVPFPGRRVNGTVQCAAC